MIKPFLIKFLGLSVVVYITYSSLASLHADKMPVQQKGDHLNVAPTKNKILDIIHQLDKNFLQLKQNSSDSLQYKQAFTSYRCWHIMGAIFSQN